LRQANSEFLGNIAGGAGSSSFILSILTWLFLLGGVAFIALGVYEIVSEQKY